MILLIALAVFDLVVGVSNDAVNFLNSAIGARVAKFRTIIFVAAIGVFVGASMSNGMMDVPRHGIMTPLYYSFFDVICLFLAVMLTDVILLDIFNTLGMPTSTTVSMVFELLGGAFAIALIKILRGTVGPDGSLLGLGDLLNTEKAISVILAIFFSVAVAFFFGTVVQWIARLIFTFTNRRGSAIKKGILAGISIAVIIWFLLINGLKSSTIMTDEVKNFINNNTWLIMGGGVVIFSLIMTLLSALRVHVLKFVVLLGTFALAMAFAGNDLVNFVGVPLTGLEAFGDFSANGNGDSTSFMMGSLMESARTPIIFLVAAGGVMVLSLIFSRKARNVVNTTVNLSRQDEGDEMFGTNALARTLVRASQNVSTFIIRTIPQPVLKWVDSRFNSDEAVLPEGAAFDEVRAIVNLVLASLLVALGTSLKLPLSTTYVTFMVAMGSSLADRAWSRESAVFRITGVITVIGGWFITAGAAFIFCLLITGIFSFWGEVAMVIAAIVAIYILVRSNLRGKQKREEDDPVFQKLMRSHDPAENWTLLCEHVRSTCNAQLLFAAEAYETAVNSFFNEEYRRLKHLTTEMEDETKSLKRMRRREILGLRRVDPRLAVIRNTWYFHTNNALSQMLHSIIRIVEPCREHVGNNFTPVPMDYIYAFTPYSDEIHKLLVRAIALFDNSDMEGSIELRTDAERIQQSLSLLRKRILDDMQKGDTNIESMSIMLNLVQESQELLSGLRHAVRGGRHFLAPL